MALSLHHTLLYPDERRTTLHERRTKVTTFLRISRRFQENYITGATVCR